VAATQLLRFSQSIWQGEPENPFEPPLQLMTTRASVATAVTLQNVFPLIMLVADCTPMAGGAERRSARRATDLDRGLPRPGLYTNILHMLTKRLTKIGDSTGIVIDRPILDMLGLDKGDEVSLRIEKDKLIIERANESATRGKRREKLEKARTRMHGDIGATLRKLAR
jgi:antitoxin MazE